MKNNLARGPMLGAESRCHVAFFQSGGKAKDNTPLFGDDTDSVEERE